MSLVDLCPSAPHRAALRLTGVAVGAAVSEALLRDLKQSDPVKIAEIANVNFVHTLLSAAQGQNDQLDAALPEDLWIYFSEMEDANAQRLAKSRDQLERIGEVFAAENLKGVVMKGGVQVLEPAGFKVRHRFLNDLDILLPIEDAPRAHARLVALGGDFTPYPEGFSKDFHHLPAIHFNDPDNVVEIHGAVGSPIVARVLTAENYLARARPSDIPGLFLPHPEDRFLHHVLHSALGRHDAHLIFLRSILDHVAFCRTTSEEDQNAARMRLEQVGLSGELRILTALTDLAFGKENSSAVVEEAKWLKVALPLFGSPGKRRVRMATQTATRILFSFITSAPHRRRMLATLKKEGLRNRLMAHLNQLYKHR